MSVIMEYRGSDAICAWRRSTGAGPTCRALQETCKMWFSWLLSCFFCTTFKLKRFICYKLYSRCYNGLIVFHRRLMARPWCFYGVTWSWSTWGWNWVLLSNFAITLRDSNWWNSGWNLPSKITEDPLEGNGGKRRSTQFQSRHQRLQSRFMDIYYPWHGWSKVQHADLLHLYSFPLV